MSPNENPQENEKLAPESLTETSPVMRWLDNFWYHYKWHTIIALFFAVILVIGLVQILGRPKTDVTVTNAFFYRMNSEERADFEKLLSRFIPEDYDGNGEKTVNLLQYEIYSEEEYYAAKAEAESIAAAEGESIQFTLNNKLNADELNNFRQFTNTGECSIFIVSPFLFSDLRDGERLRPISEIYGGDRLPAGVTEDGYGIRLSETDFYRYSPAAQVLPADTILCLYRPALVGDQSKDAKYAQSVATFRAIADFRVEE